jgi:hypothetical protein
MANHSNRPYFADMKMQGILWVFLLCLTIDAIQAQHSVDGEFNERIATGEVGLSVAIDQTSPVIGCGQPVTLTATITGATEISWKRNGEFINGATTNMFIANQPGTYQVVAISLLCQVESPPVEVILESPLNATVIAPNGLMACTGNEVQLQAGGGNAQWQWYRDNVALVDGTNELYFASEPGSYTVVGNEGSVCESVSAPIEVIIHPLPAAQLVWVENPTICPGDSATILLSGTGSEEVIWYYDETIVPGANNALVASLAGEYHALITNPNTGCSAWSNSLYLEVLPAQSIEIMASSATVFCEGESATLALNDVSGTISWYLGNAIIEGAADAAVIVYSSGVYSSRIIDANGCSFFSNQLSIETLSLPDAMLTFEEPFPVLCGEEDTLNVSAASGNTYTWYSQDGLLEGDEINTLAITTPGIYWVEVLGANGCYATSQALEIAAFAAPTLLLEPSGSVNVCEDQTQLFEAFIDAPAQLQWYINGVLLEGETNSFLESTVAGSYHVSIIDDNGCEAFSEIATLGVIAVSNPVITDGGVTAEGQLLITNQASGHQWYLNGEMIPGATASNYLAVEDGIYSVIVIEDVCESEVSDGFEVVLGDVLSSRINELTVYPNPVANRLNIAFGDLKGVTYSIYNSSGQIVFSGLAANNRMVLDVQSWSVGMYSLVVDSGERFVFLVTR